MKIPDIKPGTYLIIRTDGTEEPVNEKPTFPFLEKRLSADLLGSVMLSRSPCIVMLVDDAGWETKTVDHGGGHLEMVPLRARKPVNAKATELYHQIRRTTHQIVGDVAIVCDSDFGE
jgi:hypothetical protein